MVSFAVKMEAKGKGKLIPNCMRKSINTFWICHMVSQQNVHEVTSLCNRVFKKQAFKKLF